MKFHRIGVSIVVGLLGTVIWACSFATEKNFGFGINDSDSEDDTIVARKDFAIWWVTVDKEEWFIDNVVKSFVNRTLGLLWLIALLMVLYGWFMMLTSRDSEEWFNKWWTILKNALIGLVIIGTAWFIISLIFWLIVQSGTGVEWADTQN